MISTVRAPQASLVNPLPMPFEGWTAESPDDIRGLNGMFVASGPSDLMSVTITPANGKAGDKGGRVEGSAMWVSPSMGGLQRGGFFALPRNPMIGAALVLTDNQGEIVRVFSIVGYRRDAAGDIAGLRLQQFATADAPAPKVIEMNRF